MICETSQTPIRAASPKAGAGSAPKHERVLGMPEMARATLSDRPATSRLQGPHSRPARERLPLPSQSNWTRRSYVLSGHPFPAADSTQAVERRGTNDLWLLWRHGHGDVPLRRRPRADTLARGSSFLECSPSSFVSVSMSGAQSRGKPPTVGRIQPRFYSLHLPEPCGLSRHLDKPCMTVAGSTPPRERPIQNSKRRPV